MPSYTNSLRLVQPATGEYSGTWGTEVNNGLTALVDASIAGTSNITMTAANFTLTSNNGAADQSRAMFLVLGGTPGGSYQVICPAVSKLYFVTNNTGFAQTVKTSTGSGISVPTNRSMTLRCDGTDVVAAQNYFASLTLGAALPVNSGGTGLTSYTSGGVVYASSTSALATNSSFLFDGTNLCVGKIAVSAWGPNQSAIEVGTDAALVNDVTGNGLSGLMHNLLLNASGYSFKIGGPAYAGAYLFSRGTGSHQWLNSSAAGTVPATATMVQAMTLNASGNLGLGVTPSAWGGNQRAIEVGSFAGLVNDSTGNGLSGVMHNLVLNGGTYSFKLAASAYAGAYLFSPGTGGHQWLTSSAAGTGPATATMVQAMTLDASGVLSIGTPFAENATGVYALPAGELRVKDITENGTSQISIYNNNTTSDSEQFFVAMNGANVDLGNRRTDSGDLKLFTLNQERARITSGGEVYIAGATDQGAYNLQVNGTGVWGAGAYVNGSDERLKEDITTIDAALDVVNMLRPVTFRYKETHSKDQSIQPGFIAQELQIAMAGKAYVDGVVHSGPEYLNVAYQSLIPLLTKAIQEQQALITALTARVAALEKA